MRVPRGVVIFIFLALLFLSPKVCLSLQDTLLESFISKEADIVASIKIDNNNPGLNYISKLLKEKHMLAAAYEKKEQVEIFSEALKYQEVAGEMFLNPTGKQADFLIAIKFVDKQDIEKQESSLIKAVNRIITRTQPLNNENYLGYKITYSRDRSPHDVSAYTCIKNNMLLSNNSRVIKKAIDVFNGKNESVLKNNHFNETYSKLTKDFNGFVFINTNPNFTKLLRKWEADHYITVILSAESLNGIGILLNMVDEEKIKCKISFITRDEKALFDVVQDDVRFFEDILKRKVVYEKADYKSNITASGKYVDLDLDLGKLKAFWPRVIGGKIVLEKGLGSYSPTIQVPPGEKTIYVK